MRYKEFFFIAILSLVLSIIFTYPSILSLTSAYIGDGGDNYEFASYQMLAAKRIQEGNFPFQHTNFWRYPQGFDFQRGFDSYLTVSLGALLTLLIGMPQAYNMTIFLLMSANGIMSYLLFRKISGSVLLGMIGMIIYGFSFYVIAKAGSHPNLLFIGGITLFAQSIYNFMQKEVLKTRDYFFVSSALIIIALGSLAYFVITLLFFAFYVILFVLFYRGFFLSLVVKIRNSLVQAVLPLLTAVGTLVLCFFPHMQAVLTHSFVMLNRKDNLFLLTPSITDFFSPNTYLPLMLTRLIHSTSDASIEKVVFMGFIELLLFVLYFFSPVAKKTKLILGIAFMIPFLLALGYGRDNNFFLLPYHILANVFPFSILVEPGRYFVIFYLFLTIGVLGFLRSTPWITNKKSVFVMILVALILQRIPSNFYIANDLNADAYINIVKKQNASAVVDIPTNTSSPRYDILSFLYDKPIVNGYFHWSADGPKERKFILENLRRYTCGNEDVNSNSLQTYFGEEHADQKLIATLKKQNITTIVVHKDDKFYHPVCKNVRERLSRLSPFITPLQATSKDTEKQLQAKALDGPPSFTLYFPYDGTFYLDGAYIAATQAVPFLITTNNQQVTFPYSWTFGPDKKSMEMLPKYTTTMKVQAGSTLTFQSYYEAETTWFSLWYRYTKEKDAKPMTLEPMLKKIFDDEKATIFTIQ